MFNVDKSYVTDNLMTIASPILESYDFKRKKGVGITFRRESELSTDVLEFEIFPPSKCTKWNIPPFSFSVNAGLFYKFIPSFSDSVILEDPDRHPQEFECHFRMHVERGIWQWNCRDKSFWCVQENGRNMNKIIKDIERLINEDILPWFKQFDNTEKVYADLIDSKNENNKYKKFLKNYRLAYGVSLQIPAFLAFHSRKKNEALDLAKEALDSPLFVESYPKIQHVKMALEKLMAEAISGVR